MVFTQNFLSHEKKCERKTIATLKTTLELNEELLNFYFNLYEKQSNDSERDISLQDLSILIIHIKIIKTLNCLSGLLKRGHYCECQSIQRDVFELIYLSEYLMKNPEKVEPWFKGEQIKHGHVANNLDLPIEIRQLFGLMCDYTHPNIHGAKGNLILGHADYQIYFKEVPEFHKATANALIIQQISFMYTSMNLFFKYFQKHNNFNSDDGKQIEKIKNKWGKKVNSWVKSNSNPDHEIFPILWK